MSHLLTCDHDSSPRRLCARVDVSSSVALAATGATVASTELDSLSNEAAACLASLSTLAPVHDHAQHARNIASQPAASWDGNFSIALRLDQLLVSDDVNSLPPAITSELLRLYEYQVRRRATDAPNTTWELHASGLHDLQPIAAPGGSRL